MKNLLSTNNLVVVLLNVIIAISFYMDQKGTGYSALASDVHSIIPIGQKFDDPELFKSDLFLNSLDNVSYYTPFFVQPMRFFASLFDGDYLQGINLFGTIAHLLFGILWYFLLFKFTRNFWVALCISILLRGIVWLPGNEIWGITDIWSIMPRTIYIALMPLPFILLSATNKWLLLISGLLIGLVFNFHPITGLGGILCYIIFIACYYYFYKDRITVSLKLIPLFLMAIAVGMLPFIVTYFSKTDSAITYDLETYKVAFASRIPAFFEQPLIYLKQWIEIKYLFFILPLLVYFGMTYGSKIENRKARILLIMTMALVFFSSISSSIESMVNSVFNLNIRIAYQFIRLQKLAILPSYFAMAFLLLKLSKPKLIGVVSLFIVTLTVSKASVFNRLPLVGDDILRSILPNNLSIVKKDIIDNSATDNMMAFIAENTKVNDVFYGPPIIRGAAKRSVVLDYKGSSVIVEGNPKQFITWYKEFTALKELEHPDKVDFLKTKGVDYIVTTDLILEKVDLIHKEKALKLYKIR